MPKPIAVLKDTNDIHSNPNFPSNVYKAKFCNDQEGELGKKKDEHSRPRAYQIQLHDRWRSRSPWLHESPHQQGGLVTVLRVHLCSSCGGWAFLDPPTARVQVFIPASTRPGGYKNDCSALEPSPVFASRVICEVTLSLVPSLTLYSLFNRHLGSALLHNQIQKVGNWNQFLFFSFFFLFSILWYSWSVIVHKKV